MRKIENEILDAIRAKQNFQSGSNEVVVSDMGNMQVVLHGSPVVRIEDNEKNIFVSLAGYNTATTRSRINAVMGKYGLDKVSNKGGVPVMGGVILTSDGWIQVRRNGRGITPEAEK